MSDLQIERYAGMKSGEGSSHGPGHVRSGPCAAGPKTRSDPERAARTPGSDPDVPPFDTGDTAAVTQTTTAPLPLPPPAPARPVRQTERRVRRSVWAGLGRETGTDRVRQQVVVGVLALLATERRELDVSPFPTPPGRS